MKKILIGSICAAFLFGADVTLELQKGWNLVGFPFNTTYATVHNDKVKVIWSYGSDSTWIKDDAIEFKAGYGYWIVSEEEQSITVSGDLAASRADSLNLGWNLLSSLEESESSDKYIEGASYRVVYRYNEGWIKADSTTSTTLKRGQGFWYYYAESETVDNTTADQNMLDALKKDQAEVSVPNPPASDFTLTMKSKTTYLGQESYNGKTVDASREETTMEVNDFGVTIKVNIDTLADSEGNVEAFRFQ